MDSENSTYDLTDKSCLTNLDSARSISLNDNLDYSNLDLNETSKTDYANPSSTIKHSVDMSVTLAENELVMLDAARNQQQIGTNAESITKPSNGICDLQRVANETMLESTNESTRFENITLDDSLYTQQEQTLETEREIATDESAYFAEGCIELGRRMWMSSAEKQHYTKGCLWSPDGTCLLVPVHLDGMHLIELPHDLYLTQTVSTTRKLSTLSTAVHVKECGTVYDYVWYPFMDSNAPETCCWLASRQHEPIHMWDAFTGELRCTYRGYDDVDEVESAISIAFTNDGQKIIGGYKKSIKIFDTNVPGRDCRALPVKQAISCLALTADSNDTVTAGSWNGYINHYDLRASKLNALFTLGGHSGGITWLRYAALHDNWTLFSGARKDNKILQWDMRNFLQPVREFERTVATNQRIYFDLSPVQQRWLVSGDTSGLLRIWDLESDIAEALPLHSDCCNGVNFHPKYPILATSSGQYHFVDVAQDEEVSVQAKEKVVDYENALLLLWLGRSTSE